MFTSIKEFEREFSDERNNTLRMLEQLTDSSLNQQISDNRRTLGRIAWHIVTTYPEMMKLAGLNITSVAEHAPLPSSAKTIQDGYSKVSSELLDQIKQNWTDATLGEKKNFYGEEWALGQALRGFLTHEIHHRGQMTVLMRQAGLKVPGIYGPSFEEWTNYGMQPPVV